MQPIAAVCLSVFNTTRPLLLLMKVMMLLRRHCEESRHSQPAASPRRAYVLTAVCRETSWRSQARLPAESLYQTHASLRLLSFSFPKELSDVLSIIGIRLRLQTCRMKQRRLPNDDDIEV